MGNKDDYVDNLIEYVKTSLDFLNSWQRRVVGGISNLAIVPAVDSEDNLSREQLRFKLLVEKFLQQREEYYNNIPEINYESDGDNCDNEDECPKDERDVQTLPSTSGHDRRKFLLIRGNLAQAKLLLCYTASAKY